MVAGSSRLLRPCPLEACHPEVEPVHECVYETNRTVRANVVVHSVRKEQELGAIFTRCMCHDS